MNQMTAICAITGWTFQLAVKDKDWMSAICVVVRPHTIVLPSLIVVVLLLNYSLIDIDPPPLPSRVPKRTETESAILAAGP